MNIADMNLFFRLLLLLATSLFFVQSAKTKSPSKSPSQPTRRKKTMEPTITPTSTDDYYDYIYLTPSQKPSDQPSQIPSDQPSKKPSDQPSQKPSVQPSQIPTKQLTQMPSLKNTIQPSLFNIQQASTYGLFMKLLQKFKSNNIAVIVGKGSLTSASGSINPYLERINSGCRRILPCRTCIYIDYNDRNAFLTNRGYFMADITPDMNPAIINMRTFNHQTLNQTTIFNTIMRGVDKTRPFYIIGSNTFSPDLKGTIYNACTNLVRCVDVDNTYTKVQYDTFITNFNITSSSIPAVAYTTIANTTLTTTFNKDTMIDNILFSTDLAIWHDACYSNGLFEGSLIVPCIDYPCK